MKVDVMKPIFNLEPKYQVTMLTTEEWTKGSGDPPMVKGLVWCTGGSRTAEGPGWGSMGNQLTEDSASL